MDMVGNLVNQVETARKEFLSTLSGLTYHQEMYSPSDEQWSINQIVEHIVWAERIGVMGMWKAYLSNQPLWEGENPNKGLSIEEVIDRTWKEKEQVPDVAKPRWGGPVIFWMNELKSCAFTLSTFSQELTNADLESVIYPHPISGPLDISQRLQFLRFHMQRHQHQMLTLKNHPNFPNSN